MSFTTFSQLREWAVAFLKPKAAFPEFKGKNQEAFLGLIDLVTSQASIPDVQSPNYDTALTVTTTQRHTTVQYGLTGPTTITMGVEGINMGDTVIFELTATGATRTVTFDTVTTTPTLATIAVTVALPSLIAFVFDGSTWVEMYRTDLRAAEKATSVAYVPTIAVTPSVARMNYMNVAQLTGAATINATVTNLAANDRVIFTFAADGTNRIVTFGTNMKSAGTITVTANKYATVSFIFDGTNLLELSRAVTT